MTPNAGDPVARLLHSADTPVSPRPEFADDLLRKLLHELAPETEQSLGHRGRRAGDGLPRQHAAPNTPPVRLPERGKSRARSHLATAALVLLVLATSLYASGVWRFGQEETPPAITLEAPATPGGTPAAGTPEAIATPAAFVWRLQDSDNASFGISPQIAVAPDGNLWVIDAARDGFQIVSPDGELIERWGTSGTADGQFNFQRDAENAPGGIAFLPDGGFYVLDSQNRRVQQFAPDRTFVRAWGDFGEGDGQFVDPAGIFLDAAGNVYVLDARRGDVQKFDAAGEFLLRFDLPGERGPSGEEGPGDTHLWVADAGNGSIARFTPDGAWVQTVGGSGSDDGVLRAPRAVAVDAVGRIFVADAGAGQVHIFTPDGQIVWSFDGVDAGGMTFHEPIGMTLDQEGSLYVLDRDPEQNIETLQKFSLMAPRVP